MGRNSKRKEPKPPGTPAARSVVPAPEAPPPRGAAPLVDELASTLREAPAAAAAVLLTLAVGCGIALGGVLRNGFLNWDDDKYITENPHVQSLSLDNLKWMLTDTATFYWHPLTYLVHATEVQLWGIENARMHHATSLVLHTLVALLVFLVLVTLLRSASRRFEVRPAPGAVILAAGAAALLWAVHPLRVESVAWAAQKKDLISLLFMLLAFLAHLFSATAGDDRTARGWRRVRFASFVLAILSKPMAMVVAPVLLLLDLYPLGRLRTMREVTAAVKDKRAILIATAAAILYSLTSSRDLGLQDGEHIAPLGHRLVTSTWGFLFPLVRTLWPVDLVPIYPVETADASTVANRLYGGSLLILVILGATVAWATWRRAWALAVPALFYLVCVAPVSGLRQAGSLQTADRFAAVPSLGLFALLAGVLLWWVTRGGCHRGRNPVLAGTAALALVLAAALGSLSATQVKVWRTPETFWRTVIAAFPTRAANAYNNLGGILQRRALATGDDGALTEAEAMYRKTVELVPEHEGAWSNLGLIYLQRQDFAEAERLLRQGVEVGGNIAKTRSNLALVLLIRGKRSEAREQWLLSKKGTGFVAPDVEELLTRELGKKDAESKEPNR